MVIFIKCPHGSHHPTMIGIWSTRWLLFQVMSWLYPKWDSYQPLCKMKFESTANGEGTNSQTRIYLTNSRWFCHPKQKRAKNNWDALDEWKCLGNSHWEEWPDLIQDLHLVPLLMLIPANLRKRPKSVIVHCLGVPASLAYARDNSQKKICMIGDWSDQQQLQHSFIFCDVVLAREQNADIYTAALDKSLADRLDSRPKWIFFTMHRGIERQNPQTEANRW